MRRPTLKRIALILAGLVLLAVAAVGLFAASEWAYISRGQPEGQGLAGAARRRDAPGLRAGGQGHAEVTRGGRGGNGDRPLPLASIEVQTAGPVHGGRGD